MSTPSSSYIMQEDPSSFSFSDTSSELDSLPSSDDSSDFSSDAQAEWEASLQQLELMLTMVIVPYAGKYFGRKFAYWSWAKYMTWMYPVEVKITSQKTFKGAGAVEAAATL